MVGGINVRSGSYGHQGVAHYLDFALCLRGPVIYSLRRYCDYLHKNSCKLILDFSRPNVSKFSPLLNDLPSTNLNSNAESPLEVSEPGTLPVLDAGVEKSFRLKISINDWLLGRWQINREYADLVRAAKKDIVVINSYFFPRKVYMRQLVSAAKRGVRVRLILPKFSDWPSYILASQYLYGYFLKNGIEIYQWKKSILHGKLVTIDNSISVVGSFNLNYTSYQQNLEMNVDVFSTEFTQNLNNQIEEWISQSCEKVELKEFSEQASVKIKMLRFLFYKLLSVIAGFSVLISSKPIRKAENIS